MVQVGDSRIAGSAQTTGRADVSVRGLTGARALLHHARESGGVAPRKLPAFAGLLLRMAGGSIANSLQERAARRDRTSGAPADDPVFILGHYRSGTTLVHNLLDTDPRLAGPRTFDILFPACPAWLEPILRAPLQRGADLLRVRQPFFHGLNVRLGDPNELEPVRLATGSYWSTYWGYLFPRRANYYLNRFVDWPDDQTRGDWMQAYRDAVQIEEWRAHGRRVLLKDPPNTGRVCELIELFPSAKFVNIIRDPRDVFLSMRALWRDVIERRYALQAISEDERDHLILRHYRTLMERWMAQRELIPAGALIEVRYERIVAEPLAGIRDIYTTLKLGDFTAVERAITKRLAAELPYRPASRNPGPRTLALIDRELSEWRERLGYASS